MSHPCDLVHTDPPGGFIEKAIARLRQRLTQAERPVAAAAPAMELHISEAQHARAEDRRRRIDRAALERCQRDHGLERRSRCIQPGEAARRRSPGLSRRAGGRTAEDVDGTLDASRPPRPPASRQSPSPLLHIPNSGRIAQLAEQPTLNQRVQGSESLCAHQSFQLVTSKRGDSRGAPGITGVSPGRRRRRERPRA